MRVWFYIMTSSVSVFLRFLLVSLYSFCQLDTPECKNHKKTSYPKSISLIIIIRAFKIIE